MKVSAFQPFTIALLPDRHKTEYYRSFRHCFEASNSRAGRAVEKQSIDDSSALKEQ
jgi:hypothetical protein